MMAPRLSVLRLGLRAWSRTARSVTTASPVPTPAAGQRPPPKIQNIRRGRNPYEKVQRNPVMIVSKDSSKVAIEENVLLFERHKTVYSSGAGLMMVVQNVSVICGGAAFILHESIDDVPLYRKVLISSVAFLASLLTTIYAARSFRRLIMKLQVLKKGTLEVTAPPMLPWTSPKVYNFPLDKCSIYRHRLHKVAQRVGYSGPEREKDSFVSIYIDTGPGGLEQYSMDMRYATYLDVDGILKYVQGMEYITN